MATASAAITPELLTGRSEEHLCASEEGERLGARMHTAVVAPFTALREAAREAGFDLRIVSGFRGFARQLSIWNRKAGGELPVHDDAARPLDITRMAPRDVVLAILRWSALPGASRHHWGTDLDVYDGAAAPAGYDVALTPEEVNPVGMFGPLHAWLDERIAAGTAWGFVRPYDRDRGGVAPERWHLSHAPTARPYARRVTVGLLHAALAPAELALKDAVLGQLDEIVRRFVTSINPQAA